MGKGKKQPIVVDVVVKNTPKSSITTSATTSRADSIDWKQDKRTTLLCYH
jgi:hypothetical protein